MADVENLNSLETVVDSFSFSTANALPFGGRRFFVSECDLGGYTAGVGYPLSGQDYRVSVDSALTPDERRSVLLHEVVELYLRSQGRGAAYAHRIARERELAYARSRGLPVVEPVRRSPS